MEQERSIAAGLEKGAATLTRWTREGTIIEPQQLAMAWGQDLQALQAAVQRGDLFEVWVNEAPYFAAVFVALGIEQTAKVCQALGVQKASVKLMLLMRAHGGLGGKTVAWRANLPDATTPLKFRRRLEQHDLTAAILAEVNAQLTERGLLMRQGTVVNATIIAAPSSTKNADGKRDPEMHQAKKGKQWYFGMKLHSGIDAASGLIHSVVGIAANAADVVHARELLHGQETQAHGDSGYTRLDKPIASINAGPTPSPTAS